MNTVADKMSQSYWEDYKTKKRNNCKTFFYWLKKRFDLYLHCVNLKEKRETGNFKIEGFGLTSTKIKNKQ